MSSNTRRIGGLINSPTKPFTTPSIQNDQLPQSPPPGRLERLRNKFLANVNKANDNSLASNTGTHNVEIASKLIKPSKNAAIEISGIYEVELDAGTTYTPQRSASARNRTAQYSPQRDEGDRYRRRALNRSATIVDASLKRSRSMPLNSHRALNTAYSATSDGSIRNEITPATIKPSDIAQTVPRMAISPTHHTRWTTGSPSFILAVDPDWEASQGDATFFIFAQGNGSENGVQDGRRGDLVTLDEVMETLYPGYVDNGIVA